MGRGPSIDIFSQGRHTNGQQTQEKWLNIINVQRKRNQICNEIHILQEEWLLQRDKNPQVDKGHMRPGNFTRISQFILQLSEKPEPQHLIFVHFLPCSRSLCLKTCSLSWPPSLTPPPYTHVILFQSVLLRYVSHSPPSQRRQSHNL